MSRRRSTRPGGTRVGEGRREGPWTERKKHDYETNHLPSGWHACQCTGVKGGTQNEPPHTLGCAIGASPVGAYWFGT